MLARSAPQQLRQRPAAALTRRSTRTEASRSRPEAVQLRAALSDGVSTSGDTRAAAPLFVPDGPQATVDQAVTTIRKAWRDGVKRQRVQFLLPLIGATELDDWPGGIRQQFKAAAPMVEEMLLELKKDPELGGRLTPTIIDDGDAVGAWTSDNLAIVLFPTAETLKQVRSIAEARPQGLVILANPQWNAGQVVSDFGFGPWRARNEELVGSFRETYTFKQLRVLGEEVRILYAFPGQWQVHVAEDDGATPLVWTGAAVPSYAELEALLRARPGSKASMGWAQRLQREVEFNMRQ